MFYSITRFSTLVLSSLLVIAQHSSYFDGIEMPRIAIIGGGIGGATVSHKLRNSFGPALSTIDLYEDKNIGGRLQTIVVNGFEYETGGAIIHPANQYMVDFAKLLKLEQIINDGNFAMFDGKERIFEIRRGWLGTLQLMWRYGFDLLTLSRSISRFLTDFERIYKWQKEYHSFTSVPNLLLSMSDDLMNSTKMSLRELMTSEGMSKQLINELGLAAVRTNYAQSPDNLHGLVGSVSIAGAEPGLWSVKGGNHKVPEGLLKISEANVIKSAIAKVSNITTDPAKPLYRLHTTDGSTKDYDVVVLAFPFVQGHTSVQFSGFDTDMTSHQREYHHLHVYIVEGTPNYKHFGYDSLEQVPDQIFPLGTNEFYWSMGKIDPVTGVKSSQQVWKVFSDNILAQDQLDMLFISRTSTEIVDFFAYPQYHPDMDFVPFVLAPKMYYVNAIELAASAMEMSALAGVNIANLVVHEWMEHSHLIDNMFVIEEKHIKLEL